jgi:hypothetical protein
VQLVEVGVVEVPSTACKDPLPSLAACAAGNGSAKECDGRFGQESAALFCQNSGAVELEFTVVQAGVAHTLTGPCDLLAVGATLDDQFRPGPVTVAATFRSAPVGTADMECKPSVGISRVLRVGTNVVTVPVAMGSIGSELWTIPCESGDACIDGMDNDLDTLEDCQDPDCFVDCAAETGETGT